MPPPFPLIPPPLPASSRLYLLDEVDAALDEHNAARVGALLAQLAAGQEGGAGACQVLVSEQAAPRPRRAPPPPPGGPRGPGSLFGAGGASGGGADASRPASGLFAPTTSSPSVTWGGAPSLTNPWGGGAAVNIETGHHDGGSSGDISAQVRAAKEKIAGKLLLSAPYPPVSSVSSSGASQGSRALRGDRGGMRGKQLSALSSAAPGRKAAASSPATSLTL